MTSKAFLLLFLCLPVFGISVTENGKSNYEIVLSSDAIPAEKTAALELRTYLRLVSGAQLKIVTPDKISAGKKKILLGQTAEISRLLGGLDFKTLKSDETLRVTKGDSLILSGGRPRGTMYAVTTFLEDQVGIRWWTPEEAYFPEKKTITLDQLNLRYAPELRLRDVSYLNSWRNQDPYFIARSKLNGWNSELKSEFGGHIPLIGACHSFYRHIPPAKYQKAHPEWFSGHQLCLSNEDMRKELVKNVIKMLDKETERGTDTSMVSVCQEDARGWCECGACRKIIVEEGSLSGYLIRFVNKVAADIGKVYPETGVVTFAYDLTTSPNFKSEVAPNVVIHLAPLGSNYGKPLNDPVGNAKTNSEITGWSKKARKIIVWNYISDFTNYLVPHPNTGLLADDIRFYVENNAVGLFQQASGACSMDDMMRLKNWMCAQLMWNPERDARKLRDEFLNGYYGAGGKFLGEYLDLVDRAAAKEKKVISTYHFREPSFFTDEFTKKSLALFDRALVAVQGDPVLVKRILREKMQLWSIVLNRAFFDRVPASELVAKGLGDPEKIFREFKEMAKENKLFMFAENKHYQNLLAAYNAEKNRKNAAIPSQFKNKKVFDLQLSQLYSDRGGVKEIVDPAASDNITFRVDGKFGGWGIMFDLPYKEMDKTGVKKWEVWIAVRAEADAGISGNGFHFGAYSYSTNKPQIERNLQIGEILSQDYKLVKIGELDISDHPLLWCGGPQRSDGRVQAVYLDRILLIQSK